MKAEHLTSQSSSGSLTSFVESILGDEAFRVEENLGQGFVRLKVSEAQRRQAKQDIRSVESAVCELVRNSRDAGSRHIFIATMRQASKRTLLVIDDGCGIPAEIADRVFEARVTGKLNDVSMDAWGLHGRGMALYSIKTNADLAEIVCSEKGRGCCIRVVLDTDSIIEKADQSTLPSYLGSRDLRGEEEVLRGPHNILRSVAEIALACPSDRFLYVGSPVDILASMVHIGKRRLASHEPDALSRICAEDEGYRPSDMLPYWLLPAVAPGPCELQTTAEMLGIDVSLRTCYRILGSEIAPLRDLVSQIQNPQSCDSGVSRHDPDIAADKRQLKIAKEDLEALSASMRPIFEDLASRYYLELESEPHIRVLSDKFLVSLPFKKQD